MNQAEYIRNYRNTPNGRKKCIISNWKHYGLKDDYDKVYERYLNTEYCDLCKIKLDCEYGSKPSGIKKVMEHDHVTGKFRNITCNNCNISKSDRPKQKNNSSGYKGISFQKNKQLWVYRKQHRGKYICKRRKSKTEILCIKFAYMILYQY